MEQAGYNVQRRSPSIMQDKMQEDFFVTGQSFRIGDDVELDTNTKNKEPVVMMSQLDSHSSNQSQYMQDKFGNMIAINMKSK